MNEADRAAYIDRYRGRLDQFGYDPRTLGWTSGKQDERFTAATSLFPIHQLRSVLDVGCGFGDLYGFLKAHGFRGNYCGIDFMPELVKVGRERHPDATFIVGDFSEHVFDMQFDLVTASGIFNARLKNEDQHESIHKTLLKMVSLSQGMVSADFLSTQADLRREDLYYSDPAAMLNFAQTITRRCSLLHHYLPFEFCLYLFVNDTFDAATRYGPVLPTRVTP